MNRFPYRAVTLAAVMASACVLAPTATLAGCRGNNNANLVNNGGFESGSGSNIPGWTAEWKSTVDKFVYLDTTTPHSGAQDLALGSVNAPNDVLQSIKGASSGAVYTICFWLYSSPNPSAGVTTFEVMWNNVPELALTNSGPFAYQYLSFNVVAQDGVNFLRFRERNKQGYYYLDDVSVQECTGCSLGAEGNPAKQKE